MAFPGSSYLYGSPSHLPKTSRQARGARATACGTRSLERAGGGGPEPARGERFPQGSAGPASRALQTEEHFQQRKALAGGPISEPRPAEEAAEDHPSDWLSRSTGSQPAKWPDPATTGWRPSRRLRSAPSGRGWKARLSTARRLTRCLRRKGGG